MMVTILRISYQDILPYVFMAWCSKNNPNFTLTELAFICILVNYVIEVSSVSGKIYRIFSNIIRTLFTVLEG
jgi:hypothetical protein